MSTTVTTQAEMDAALAAGAETIIIRSPRGVRLTISDSGSSTVEAYDLSEAVGVGNKLKARSCRVLHEVDARGNAVPA